jgi:hypothetical protein
MTLTIPVPKPDQPANCIATAGWFSSKGICQVYTWHGICQVYIPVRYIPDIYLTYAQLAQKEYLRHIPGIWPNDLESICQTYQTYDMVCHIPDIYRNMSEMSHKWSYSRYRPRISNFYRFRMQSCKLPSQVDIWNLDTYVVVFLRHRSSAISGFQRYRRSR